MHRFRPCSNPSLGDPGKYDVMTHDNCLPLQDPSLLAINGFAVPQTAKLAEKRKLIEEIAHNDVKKVSLELDLM